MSSTSAGSAPSAAAAAAACTRRAAGRTDTSAGPARTARCGPGEPARAAARSRLFPAAVPATVPRSGPTAPDSHSPSPAYAAVSRASCTAAGSAPAALSPTGSPTSSTTAAARSAPSSSRWPTPCLPWTSRRRAGQPMNPDALAALVNDIGIPTTAGRASAIRQHVLEMPAPVVADALGYHPVTTAKLAAQVAATSSRYAPGDHLWSPSGRKPGGNSRQLIGALTSIKPLSPFRASRGAGPRCQPLSRIWRAGPLW
jgi:hypothetical protein